MSILTNKVAICSMTGRSRRYVVEGVDPDGKSTAFCVSGCCADEALLEALLVGLRVTDVRQQPLASSLMRGFACLLRRHEWETISNVCKAKQICARCLRTEDVDVHTFGDYVTGVDDCRLRRICSKCGRVEHAREKQHAWTPWEWETSTHQCWRTRSCSRCGELQREMQHAWTPWETSTHQCSRTRSCPRCGDSQREHHAPVWGQWTNGDDNRCKYRCCSICGQWDYKDHRFGFSIDNGNGTTSSYCEECGYEYRC